MTDKARVGGQERVFAEDITEWAASSSHGLTEMLKNSPYSVVKQSACPKRFISISNILPLASSSGTNKKIHNEMQRI